MTTPSDKIWFYVSKTKQFKCLRRDHARFDWDYPHTPPGMVCYRTGKSWQFCSYGATPEEAAASENQFATREILKLEEKIDSLRAVLVKVPADLKR